MNARATRAVLDVVGDAPSAPSLDAYHAALLAALGRALPCDVLSFNEFRIGPRPSGALSVSCAARPLVEPARTVAPPLLEAFARHMADHPLIRIHAGGERTALRLSDAVAMRAFRRQPLYGEFFRPARIRHQLTLGLAGPPRRLIGVWANRSDRDFTDAELVLGELLRPHLVHGEAVARRAAARATLTVREREVLDAVAAGATNAEVAEALVISPGTVKKHLDNIYAKLDVRSRTSATHLAAV